MTTLIEEKDVTLATLSLALESAVISHKQDGDNSLYIVEDSFFPCWIRIFEDIGFVAMRTYTNFRSSANRNQQMEICNELNSINFVATACARDKKLMFDHVLNYRDGLLKEDFIRTVRQFSDNITEGLKRVDEENCFILGPGESETEENGHGE